MVFAAPAPGTMRTPRVAATSRAQGVTMAPAEVATSPPGATARTSSAVTMSFMEDLPRCARMIAYGPMRARVLLAASLLSPSCQSREPPPLAPRPSLLLITVDTLRADRLGCYGDS